MRAASGPASWNEPACTQMPSSPRGVGEERGELAVDRLRLGLAGGPAEVVHVLRKHREIRAGRPRPASSRLPAAARFAARSSRALSWQTATRMAAA